ncbi:MAG TPA: response regulator transcription factor [Oceanithermus profundus]|uniref:Response regulator transcription factor n=1 Tax=Oceanithermus profundus TaxID=187137 RepID=A0A7C4ZSA4_9DEIN|nr:response regulator transcription factor [Oceanithermus profundus]
MRLLIADDHPLFRIGLRAALEKEGFSVVAEAGDGDEAVRLVETHRPEVVILDIRMPRMDGIEACALLRQKGYEGLVVMLTTFTEAAIQNKAASAGANAYYSKEVSPAELARRILRLTQNPEDVAFTPPPVPSLTPREREVLDLLARGLTAREMGDILGLKPDTVRDYLKRLYGKLDAGNRIEALEQARRLGFLDSP